MTQRFDPNDTSQPTPDPPSGDRDRVLWFAETQLGVTDPTSFWLDAYGALPDKMSRAWCGVFYLWCLRQAGLVTWHWPVLFSQKLHVVSEPSPGDLAYFDQPYQHHAAVMRSEGDTLWLIQGNYGSPGRVAQSMVSHRQKRPIYYSIEKLVTPERLVNL